MANQECDRTHQKLLNELRSLEIIIYLVPWQEL